MTEGLYHCFTRDFLTHLGLHISVYCMNEDRQNRNHYHVFIHQNESIIQENSIIASENYLENTFAKEYGKYVLVLKKQIVVEIANDCIG